MEVVGEYLSLSLSLFTIGCFRALQWQKSHEKEHDISVGNVKTQNLIACSRCPDYQRLQIALMYNELYFPFYNHSIPKAILYPC